MTQVVRGRLSGPPDARRWSEVPVEAAGIAHRLDPSVVHNALHRASRLGVGLDETLLAAGHVSPDELGQAAAREIGAAFEPLDRPFLQGPTRVGATDIVAMLRSGVMRTADGRLIVAARGLRLRRLAATLDERPELRGRISLTTPERLASFVRSRFARQLGWQAAYRLRDQQPDLSAGTLTISRYLFGIIAFALATLFLTATASSFFGAWVLPGLVALMLVGSATLKLGACTIPPQPPPRPARDDASLPDYSLIVPLYREARVVPQLVDALDALDYPREKLQVLLVIEADDEPTATALALHARRPGFEVIVAPNVGPRTKPKALNAALPFARGSVVGVYDAEDVPDPLQLRQVCTTLKARGNGRIGCVQARLVIDNLADGWIPRQFAAEYAGYFDVVLPMLGHFQLPLPLGGTSNHFRRAALDAVGGWDPFNVTEDADLGVRLARTGWSTEVIASATDEEAPRRLGPWMRQRTRWYKGWMQTLLVHARQPLLMARTAGWPGTLTLLFLLGSGTAAALLHPVLVVSLLLDAVMEPDANPSLVATLLDAIWFCVLLAGLVGVVLSTLMGMRRRGIPGIARVAALMPVYWLMMSAAAWRALIELVVAPSRWAKTEHGLARTSRRRQRPALRLRSSGAVRPQPPLGAALS
ncbi:cellulose synthase/poly-beta-1,6-N-acetylglucosamine synthase-like glycosyltransferase [Ancylobacter aquaticus]|uniref:Cellulose synthase/poly-beta-1,6-N-acetylglucosamine synthase-like glycosyltransferase n=1 Tax=Ancylobacter aquaticus TaxID=100 RepID=A0A4R1IA43_ANCAQ|nr:glycosyltransferase [Ancylobacter aquaticus]TCK31161.1 cellulose synthase/poly-beta-1,6-N-acetylglucosamine synthase-like glycosyltransferase [Ancylobacter aquaticus]